MRVSKQTVISGSATIFGGVGNVTLEPESADLGYGVVMRQAYAHLFSPCMMAFSPPTAPGRPHGGPWRAATGGFSHDISIELEVPAGEYPGGLSQHDVLWWIAALLRLAHYPYLNIPVISTRSLRDAAHCEPAPVLTPFEVEYRMFGPGPDGFQTIDQAIVDWLTETWAETAKTMLPNENFNRAIRAFDACTVQGRNSSTMLALWGGLEQLFSPGTTELRYRVSSNIAAYLHPFGPERLKRQREMMQLYNARSTAAHTASEVDVGPIVQSYVIMRNSLMKMVNDQHIPTQSDLEGLLFSGSAPIQSGFPAHEFKGEPDAAESQ
jgi:hypothetical protein